MKNIYILLVIFIVIFSSCTKNNSKNEEISNFDNDINSEIVNKDIVNEPNVQLIYNDKDNEIYEKILGNWVIFEKNGQPIFQYDIPRYDDEYTLGFKKQYFFRYTGQGPGGGYELAWKVENEKIYIINNYPDDNYMKDWVNSFDEIIGNYDVEFLTKKIISLNHENGNVYKCYLLEYPLYNGEFIEDLNTLKLFLENRSNLEIRYTYNTTLLMYFIIYGFDRPGIENALYLIKNGINIEETNIYGQTALHYAVSWKRLEVIEELLKNNIDINKIDDFGQTPLDIMELDYNKNVENGERVRQLLISNGAVGNKNKNGT